MRFFAYDRRARILLPLLNLGLCVLQTQTALRHPSTEHWVTALCWGLIALLNAANFWGTYWKITPQGLVESKLLFVRRIIPYDIIQDISPDPVRRKWDASWIRIAIFLGKPVIARPDEYAGFISALEQHVDPSVIHV
jgi:hypothetical protein